MSDSTSVPNSSQAFSMADFENALQEYDYEFTRGQKIQGTVVQTTSDGAYIDIGGKSPAFVPTNEAALGFVSNIDAILPVGETKEFLIIREQDADGQVTLSLRQLALDEAWADIKEMAEAGKSTQLRVTGVNKGGVMGEVYGLRAFIPRSHLQQRDNLESLVGQLLTATFLEVNQENRKLVLSQRDAMRAVAMNSIEEGALMPGKIVNIKPYGVFVDLDGATGLLHIKEISKARVESLSSIFEVGQQIKVIIKQIDELQNRMSLSIKSLESYPGENLEKLETVMADAESRWSKAQSSDAEVSASPALQSQSQSQSQSESAEPDVKEPTAEVPVAEVPVAEVPKVAPTDSEATPNSPAAESNVQADSSATPEADS
ncbi:MAG: S1 RNA-binding domain-containing protein [Cyanobacteria bacterium J06629_2]